MCDASPFLGAPTVLDAALLLPRRTGEQVRAFLDGVAALANAVALELDLAMTLAWLARVDPEELGYSSLSAFYAEHVDWGPSWRKQMVAFVSSELDDIKQAALDGRLPLRAAVRAPGQVAIAEQSAWLAAQLDATDADPIERRVLEAHEGSDAEVIREARRVARVCLGRASSARELDDYVLRCHREQVPVEQLLAEARTRPAPPAQPRPLSRAWCSAWWSEPASVAEARARLERTQAILRGRTATLARAWIVACDEALWTELPGEAGAEDLARAVFGVSLRQAQRYAALGWALEWDPALDEAIREGLAPRSAAAIACVAGEHDLPRWLEVAARVGRRELLRAVADAREDGGSGRTLSSYEKAIALATTCAGPTAGVALPHPPPHRPHRPVRAPAGLLAAAAWWNRTCALPTPSGFQAIKGRDAWTCRSPWCGRTSLRSEAHHVEPRSAGGSDDAGNGLTVCRACHLRGLHGGRLAVERVSLGGRVAWLWSHEDGRQILAFEDRPEPSAWPAP